MSLILSYFISQRTTLKLVSVFLEWLRTKKEKEREVQVLRLKGIDLLNIFHGVILFYMIILISVDFKRRKNATQVAPLGCPPLEKRQVQIHKNKI